jgi:hypothetical protein
MFKFNPNTDKVVINVSKVNDPESITSIELYRGNELVPYPELKIDLSEVPINSIEEVFNVTSPINRFIDEYISNLGRLEGTIEDYYLYEELNDCEKDKRSDIIKKNSQLFIKHMREFDVEFNLKFISLLQVFGKRKFDEAKLRHLLDLIKSKEVDEFLVQHKLSEFSNDKSMNRYFKAAAEEYNVSSLRYMFWSNY